MMHNVILLLGSNMGNKQGNLQNAISMLMHKGIIYKKSAIYITDAWGNKNQEDFYNMAVWYKTNTEPQDLIKYILACEESLGRKRIKKWEPRTIDIDIIFYNHNIINRPALQVPHPQMHLRRFVLEPIADIAADYMHPVFNKSVAELLAACNDDLKVKQL